MPFSFLPSVPVAIGPDLSTQKYLHLRKAQVPLKSLRPKASSGLSLSFQCFRSNQRKPLCFANSLRMSSTCDPNRSIAVKSASGSMSSAGTNSANVKEEEKSEAYSHDMTEAMGAVLTYRHELGMNYNFICPDLIVGSCLQTPEDVDKLRVIGVKTIFCLQQDPDLEYFGVDIKAIQEYAGSCNGIQHLRAEIDMNVPKRSWNLDSLRISMDFDAFDLRMRLPSVVSKLCKAINRNGGVTYIHCTAGLGRAPAVALAYMFWVQGYKLDEAYRLLLSKRSCFPNLDAIKSATADIRMPLHYDDKQGLWILERELPIGHYEYKYIVDGEWTCNQHELVTSPNKDGHVNNYLQVIDENADACLRKRLIGEDTDLTKDERLRLIQSLEALSDEEP